MMDYRIEKMEGFRIVGAVLHSTMEDNSCYQQVPAFWGEMMQAGRQIEILGLMNRRPYGLIGANVYNTDADDARKFDYYIACASDKPAPEGMEECLVPAADWAVFPCKRQEIGKVQIEIFTQWLPGSGYELLNSGYETGFMQSGAPDLEVYTQGEDAEVWVAVKKKL